MIFHSWCQHYQISLFQSSIFSRIWRLVGNFWRHEYGVLEYILSTYISFPILLEVCFIYLRSHSQPSTDQFELTHEGRMVHTITPLEERWWQTGLLLPHQGRKGGCDNRLLKITQKCCNLDLCLLWVLARSLLLSLFCFMDKSNKNYTLQ